MAKYSTKRKFKYKAQREEIDLVEQNVNQTVNYINDWKRKELVHLALYKSNKTPVCIPISKNSYLIGKFGMRKTESTWILTNLVEEKNYEFSKRSSAVLYAICYQVGRYKLANEIMLYDSDVLRLRDQSEILKYKLENAIAKKDHWRIDYFNILSTRASFRLQDAKNQLEKTTNLAKYFKIWE